jgi:hypothetical protein
MCFYEMKFFKNILEYFDSRSYQKWLDGKENIDWKTITKEIIPHIENHTIFLQKRNGDMILLSDVKDNDLEVIMVAVVYIQEGIEPWDREIPAKYMSDKLKRQCKYNVGVAINRNPDSFTGYYVQINT